MAARSSARRGRILVINPNSTEAVTEGVSAALEPFRFPGGPAIDCATLAEGPPGVETQAHVDGVVEPLCDLIRREEEEADAFVIACYSDPGLHTAREISARPVLGISECGMLTACTRGERFGVLAILPTSVPRHLRHIRQLGLAGRFAGDRPLDLGVVELADRDRTIERAERVGAALRDADGADVLILGCAGMAWLRAPLEQALGVPVIDPTQAAVAMAIGRIAAG